MTSALRDFLAVRPVLVLDGAMGTELERRGARLELPLWSAQALIHAPHLVRAVHADYAAAGADLLTTATFRTNLRALRRAGLAARWEELNLRAVQLAFEARDRAPGEGTVLIAASIGPVEDCYAPELAPDAPVLLEEHALQASLLAQSGADLLLFETIGTVREAEAAARAGAATDREFCVGFLCGGADRLLSGEPLADAVRAVLPCGPAALFVNCIPLPLADAALRELLRLAPCPAGCYANTMHSDTDSDAGATTHADAGADAGGDAYAGHALRWASAGARIVGGCCGSTPEMIRRVAAALRGEPSTPRTLPS